MYFSFSFHYMLSNHTFAYTLMHDGQTNEPGNTYCAIYSEVPVTLALVQATDEETKEAYHEMIFSVRLS